MPGKVLALYCFGPIFRYSTVGTGITSILGILIDDYVAFIKIESLWSMSRSCDSAVITSADIPQGEYHLSLVVLSGHGWFGGYKRRFTISDSDVWAHCGECDIVFIYSRWRYQRNTVEKGIKRVCTAKRWWKMKKMRRDIDVPHLHNSEEGRRWKVVKEENRRGPD